MSTGGMLLTAFIAYLIYKLLTSGTMDKEALKKKIATSLLALFKENNDHLRDKFLDHESALRSGDPVKVDTAIKSLLANFEEVDKEVKEYLDEKPAYQEAFNEELKALVEKRKKHIQK